MAEAAKAEKFSIRHYEALRREVLAPAIGAVGIEGAQTDELETLRYRRRVEITSVLAEGIKPENLRSVIDTHYPIEVLKGKLVAEDNEPIEDMMSRAIEKDDELAGQDPFFAPFLPYRTRSESEELHEQQAMVRGETNHNTIVTFSPYSEEYDDGTDATHVKLIRAQQKPYWKRAMVRVSHARDNQLHLFTISIDNASVELLKETARAHFGYEFTAVNSTEMLGERLRLSITDESWLTLTKDIARAADKILEERHGGRYKQGNPEQDVRQAQEYVESQSQVVDALLAADAQLAIIHNNYESYETAFNDKLYNAIALLGKRLELGNQDERIINYEVAASGAGAIARAEGKSYDACGMVIGTGEQGQTTIGQKTGFESLLRLENKKIKCPECNNKVVVPKEDLENGHLSCKECGYDLDVCTGKKTFREKLRQVKTKAVSAFDIITNAFRRNGSEGRIKRLVKRREAATNQADILIITKNIEREAKELEEVQQAA